MLGSAEVYRGSRARRLPNNAGGPIGAGLLLFASMSWSAAGYSERRSSLPGVPAYTTRASAHGDRPPPSEAAREGMEMLKRGAVAYKYSRSGKPRPCRFFLTRDEAVLCWEGDRSKTSIGSLMKTSESRSIALCDVRRLLLGREGTIFQRFAYQANPATGGGGAVLSGEHMRAAKLSITLVLHDGRGGARHPSGGGRQTLDISFDDERLFALWVAAFRCLVPVNALGPDPTVGAQPARYGPGTTAGVPPPPPADSRWMPPAAAPRPAPPPDLMGGGVQPESYAPAGMSEEQQIAAAMQVRDPRFYIFISGELYLGRRALLCRTRWLRTRAPRPTPLPMPDPTDPPPPRRLPPRRLSPRPWTCSARWSLRTSRTWPRPR